MMTTGRTTIRLSDFGAATPRHATAESIFAAWLSGEVAPSVPIDQPDGNTWEILTTQAITPALPPTQERRDCGFILATTKGNMQPFETWFQTKEHADYTSTPPRLSDDLCQLTQRFGFGGPAMVVSTACSSGLTALIEAAMMLQSGEAEQMVVCAADIANGFIQDGFNALKAITKTRCRPFDRQRDGLALGSAAAACRVRSGDHRRQDGTGRSILLEGWGIASDATHLTAPDRDASGLMRALRKAMANVESKTIDAVMLHGTGTAYNDAMEALAIGEVFDHAPYLTAAKGFLGHTLGASGIIETILAAWMLHRQVVPAITGLEDPQWPELNFVHKAAAVTPLKRMLKTASGFGGLNAVLMLGTE